MTLIMPLSQPAVLPSNASPSFDPIRARKHSRRRKNRHARANVVDDIREKHGSVFEDPTTILPGHSETSSLPCENGSCETFVNPGNDYDYPFYYQGYSGPTGLTREQQEKELEARRLVSLFAQCEGYIKYRNPHPKDDRKVRLDNIWPDHLEDAFLRALVTWPPMGRQQRSPRPGAKLMGRNELIADYIFTATGEVRTRKQVSSHIQVLKPFVLNEPDIMFFLSTSKDSIPQNGASRRHAAAIFRRYASTHDGKLSIQQQRLRMRPSQSSTLDLEIADFSMFMRTNQDAKPVLEALKTLHTYTACEPFEGGQRSDVRFTAMQSLLRRFPELADTRAIRYKSGKLIAMEASISLHNPHEISMQAPSKPGTPSPIELAILFGLRAQTASPPGRVECRTSIYRFGVLVPEATDAETEQPKLPGFDKVDVTPIRGHNDAVDYHQFIVTNFRSNFWAQTIWRLAGDNHAANGLTTKPLDPSETQEMRQAQINALRRNVALSCKGITAVQEIFASDPSGGSDRQVVLTIHWSFSQATDGRPGETTWRNVIVPATWPDQRHALVNTESLDSSFNGIGTTGGAANVVDFSQPISISPSCPITSYPADGDISLNVLRSPISFPATTMSTSTASAWGTSSGIIPSSIIGEGLQDQFINNMNDIDFTGGHITMTFDDDGGKLGQTSTVASQDHDHYQTSQAVDDMDLSNLGEMPTDPLLLQPYNTDSLPWPLLRNYSDSFFNTTNMTTKSAEAGHFQQMQEVADLVEYDYEQASFPAPTAAMVALPSNRTDHQRDLKHGKGDFDRADGVGSMSYDHDYFQSYAQQQHRLGDHHLQHQQHQQQCQHFEVPFGAERACSPPQNDHQSQFHYHQAFAGAAPIGNLDHKTVIHELTDDANVLGKMSREGTRVSFGLNSTHHMHGLDAQPELPQHHSHHNQHQEFKLGHHHLMQDGQKSEPMENYSKSPQPQQSQFQRQHHSNVYDYPHSHMHSPAEQQDTRPQSQSQHFFYEQSQQHHYNQHGLRQNQSQLQHPDHEHPQIIHPNSPLPSTLASTVATTTSLQDHTCDRCIALGLAYCACTHQDTLTHPDLEPEMKGEQVDQPVSIEEEEEEEENGREARQAPTAADQPENPSTRSSPTPYGQEREREHAHAQAQAQAQQAAQHATPTALLDTPGTWELL